MLNPISKIIIEIKINEKICNTKKDSRLGKEMLCYQLSKRLSTILDESSMMPLIRVFDDMDESLIINIKNHHDYKLSKKDAIGIKTAIAREISSYVQNPSKEITENIISEKKRGGVLAALLQQDGAAMGRSGNEESTRIEIDAIADYAEKVERHDAYIRSKEICELIKERHPEYNLFVMLDGGRRAPKFHFQITKNNTPYLWMPIESSTDDIMAVIAFIERFTNAAINVYKDGLVTGIYGLIDAQEHLETMPNKRDLIRTELDYMMWSEPYIKGFLRSQLWFSDVESDAHIPKTSEGMSWLGQLRDILGIIFRSQKSDVNSVVISRLM